MEIEIRLGYLAGFFDGEGCVSVGDNGNIALRVINTNLEVLELFKEKLGGSIGSRTQIVNKKQYTWSVYGNNALKVASVLSPYCIEKKLQLEEIVNWYNRRQHFVRLRKPKGKGWDADPNRIIAIKETQELLTKMKMGDYAKQ